MSSTKRLPLLIELVAALAMACFSASCRDVESLRAEWAASLEPVALDALGRHDAYVRADESLAEPERGAALAESSECRAAIAAADPPAVQRAWPRPRDRLAAYLDGDPDLNADEIGLAVQRLLRRNLETIERLIADGLSIR